MNSYWVIIPAAGRGERFNHDRPKQYCVLHGKTIIEQSLSVFLKNEKVKQIVVALSSGDQIFRDLSLADDPRIKTVVGGESRMQSVKNALEWIKTVAQPHDWVMVHDAARPALHSDDLENLITSVGDDPVGGILASRVQDTLKFVMQSERISHTVSRSCLWQALTPQLFRLEVLLEGIHRCEQIGLIATDEAQAVEQSGYKPKVVTSRHPNPKLTLPEDSHYLSYLLKEEKEEICV